MWVDIQNEVNKIYNALSDDESRMWFEARIQYMVDRDENAFFEKIKDISKKFYKKWRNSELEEIIDENQNIIIYGCGHDGRITKKVLNMLGYDIICWCDSSPELYKTYVEKKIVISPEDLYEKYRNCLLIIGSHKNRDEIRVRLNDVGFPVRNIFEFVYYPGINVCGNQYFDVFEPEEKEVFIDAGAYNGDSLNQFLKWKNDSDYKVYCCEPSKNMCDIIINKNIPNVEVINCAVWNENVSLKFSDSMRGGSVCRNQGMSICGRTIDSIVGNDKVTFIKMDIEGAEMNALKGAHSVIKKNQPKLAICIYHKADDILNIGSYILNLNPDYKFIIRHYTSCMWETVLYAV